MNRSLSYFGLLGYDSMYCGRWVPSFRTNTLPAFSTHCPSCPEGDMAGVRSQASTAVYLHSSVFWIAGCGRCGKEKNLFPLPGFFLYSLVHWLYFIRTCVFVFIALHVAFKPLPTARNTNINAPGGIRTRNFSKRSAEDPRLRPHFFLYFIVLCSYFIRLDCPAFCLFIFTYNTNTHASRRIRTRNPSKRAAADPRLLPLGHWVRPAIRTPDRPADSLVAIPATLLWLKL